MPAVHVARLIPQYEALLRQMHTVANMSNNHSWASLSAGLSDRAHALNSDALQGVIDTPIEDDIVIGGGDSPVDDEDVGVGGSSKRPRSDLFGLGVYVHKRP